MSKGLCIGDIVSIRHVSSDEGWLSAEGMVDEDCYLRGSREHFENCLWEVHVQRQYSAIREYEEAVYANDMIDYELERRTKLRRISDGNESDSSSDSESDNDEETGATGDGNGNKNSSSNNNSSSNKKSGKKVSTSEMRAKESQARKDHILNLRKSMENEERMNAKLMKMKTGKPVAYGDIIQLRHVKSQKFMTVSSMHLAKNERENMRVNLHVNGSVLSYLVIAPRFKIDHEGEEIRDNAEGFIKVHERSSEYIHASKTPVKLQLGMEDKDKTLEINCSLETSCWAIDIYQRINDMESGHISAGNLVTIMESETKSFVSIEGQEPGLQQAKVVMTPPHIISSANFSTEVGTNFLWLIEMERYLVGGAVIERKSRIRLRDLNSDLYMRVEKEKVLVVRGVQQASLFEMAYQQSDRMLNRSKIHENTPINLLHGNMYLSARQITGDNDIKNRQENETRNRICIMSTNKTEALSLKMSATIQRLLGVDLNVGVRATMALRNFENAARFRHKNKDVSDRTEDITRHLISTLDLLLRFLQPDQTIEFESWNHGKLDAESQKRLAMRQTLLREQGVLNAIIDIIHISDSGALEGMRFDGMFRSKRTVIRRQKNTLVNRTTFVADGSGSNDTDLAKKSRDDLISTISSGADTIAGAISKAGNVIRSTIISVPSYIKGFSARESTVVPSLHPSLAGSGDRSQSSGVDGSPKFNRGRRASSMIGALSITDTTNKRNASNGKRNSTMRSTNRLTTLQQSKLNTTKVFRKEASLSNIDEDLKVDMGQKVRHFQHMCFLVLYIALKGNHLNQSLVADHFTTILDMISYQPLAIMCVNEMLRDNTTILYNKVREREINKLVTLMNGSTMNGIFLRILRETCSSPAGVDGTQRMVTQALFGLDDTKVASSPPKQGNHGLDIIRENSLSEDASDCVMDDMNITMVSGRDMMIVLQSVPAKDIARKKFYLKPIFAPIGMNGASALGILSDNPESKTYCMGLNILRENARRIYISWKCDSIEGHFGQWSMAVLFGCEDKVPLELATAVYKQESVKIKAKSRRATKRTTIMGMRSHITNAVKSKSLNQGTKNIHDRRVEVTQFFVNQLYLVADLCLDRQYQAMGVLERLYSYETLVSIIRQSSYPNIVKAPVCKIIRTLYIDKEPQVAGKFPRLIRTSITLQGGDEDFSTSHSGSPYVFVILQQFISEYLHNKFDATKCDELSAEVMDMLEALIKFGFYSTPVQLKDVIEPLVGALDAHRRGKTLNTLSGTNQDEDEEDHHSYDQQKFSWSSCLKKIASLYNGMWSTLVLQIQSKLVPVTSKPRAVANLVDERRRSIDGSSGRRFSAADLSQSFLDAQFIASNKGHQIEEKRKSISGTENISNPNTMLMLGRHEHDRQMKHNSWQAKALAFFDSLTALSVVLVLVVVAVVISIMEVAFYANQTLDTIDFIISVIFMIEISVRMICYFAVYNEVFGFLQHIYNLFDLLVVVIDVLYIILKSQSGNAGALNTLGGLKLFRLVRVLRVTRLAKKIREAATKTIKWTLPDRYLQVKLHEARTMVGMLRNLSEINDRILDRRLGTCIKAFVQWFDAHSSGIAKDPHKIYAEVIATEEDLSKSIPSGIQDVLLDIIMHDDDNLVQEGLRLLMMYASSDALLLQATRDCQIIYSPSTEAKLKSLTTMLRDLTRYAEMFEIWGDMSTESSRNTYVDMLDSLTKMLTHLQKRNSNEKFGNITQYTPDSEVQRLILNMDAMSCFTCIQDALHTSNGPLSPDICKLISVCNDVIKWFVMDNDANQIRAFQHIEDFVERTEAGVNAGQVIHYILRGNRNLIKQCPRRYINDFAMKIMAEGHKPEYLDLMVGMTEPSSTGLDASVTVVRNEICRVITAREWKPHILLWCCGPNDNEAYQARKAMMSEFVTLSTSTTSAPSPIVEDDALPDKLRYHIKLLTLLSGLKLGPKLQAIYPLQDIIHSILDEGTIHNVRRKLILLLEECIISSVDLVEGSEYMWKFIDHVILFFDANTKDLKAMLHKPYNQPQCILHAEWMNLCIDVCIAFYSGLDLSSLDDIHLMGEDVPFDLTKRTYEDMLITITNFRDAVEAFRDVHSELLETQLMEKIDYLLDAIDSLGIVERGSEEDDETATATNLIKQNPSFRTSRMISNSVTFADIQQVYYRQQFIEFAEVLAGDQFKLNAPAMNLFEKLTSQYDTTSTSDIRIEPLIRKLSSHFRGRLDRSGTSRTLRKDDTESCLWLLQTFRYIIEKHCGAKVMEVCNLEHLELHKRTESEGHNLNTAYAFQSLMNNCGITHLCLDLITQGSDNSLCLEALNVLIMLLWRRAGNYEVQLKIHEYLLNTDSSQFFDQVKELLEFMLIWSQREGESNPNEDIMHKALTNYSAAVNKMKGASAKKVKQMSTHTKTTFENEKLKRLPDESKILTLLGLICEGRLSVCRDIIRDQDMNTHNVPILDTLAHYVEVLSNSAGDNRNYAAIQVIQAIHKLIHGPCKGNQDYFVIRTDLLSSLNRIMRVSKQDSTQITSQPDNNSLYKETNQQRLESEKLQECVIDVLRAFLEGQGENSVVFERISTSIELNVLNMLVFGAELEIEGLEDFNSSLSGVQSKYLVFLATLGRRRGELPPTIATLMNQHVAFVDIVWNQEVQRNYFHIPYVVLDLSMASIENITKELDYSTHENKLRGFAKGVFTLFLEVVHQQTLKRFGVGNVWGMKKGLTWIMLLIAVVMNGLVLFNYSARTIDDDDHRRLGGAAPAVGPNPPHTEAFMPSDIATTVRILNAVQIVLAFATFLIFLIVRIPVVYLLKREEGSSEVTSILSALMDPQWLWYCVYLAICIFTYAWKGVEGEHRSEIYLSILLLDFVFMSDTTQHVLRAVVLPFKQLIATLTIMAILITVFNGFLFEYARDDSVNIRLTWLWDAWKTSLSYGIRGEHGVAHELLDSVDTRLLMDFIYYLVIVSILRNIFFGIIIDTFGKLRETEMEQQHQANNTCFICGVAKIEFDKRSIPGANSFKNHREGTHNKYSYLNFLIALWYNSPEADNGIEMFVRNCVSTGDVSWFPMGMNADEMESEDRGEHQITDSSSRRESINLHHMLSKLTDVGKRRIKLKLRGKRWNFILNQ